MKTKEAIRRRLLVSKYPRRGDAIFDDGNDHNPLVLDDCPSCGGSGKRCTQESGMYVLDECGACEGQGTTFNVVRYFPEERPAVYTICVEAKSMRTLRAIRGRSGCVAQFLLAGLVGGVLGAIAWWQIGGLSGIAACGVTFLVSGMAVLWLLERWRLFSSPAAVLNQVAPATGCQHERPCSRGAAMPLTPAHAALAWPLSSIRRLPVAALVIGTLSPDFEYILRLAPSGTFAHSLLGVALFCVPASMLLFVLFERAVGPALLDLLPAGFRVHASRRRPEGGSRARRQTLAWAAPATALGALSHVLWDAFTHETGWMVAQASILTTSVDLPGPLPRVPAYKLLQHCSTLLGLAALVAWTLLTVRRIPADSRRFEPKQRLRFLRSVAVLLCASGVAGALNSLRAQGRGLAPTLGFAAVGSMAGLFLGLLAITAANRYRRAVAEDPTSFEADS